MQLTSIESVTTVRSNSTFLIRACRVLAAMLLLAPLSSVMAGTLYIGGSPPATVSPPRHYYFRPWIAGSDKASAKFAIRNKPYWASFDPSTGTLSGRVYPAEAGKYASITIIARSATSFTHMPPFSITVTSSGGTSPPPASGAPTISGAPGTSVVAVSTPFSFQPTASDPAGRKLTFSVNAKPSWTSFDSTTGRLYGTPGAVNVGTTSNIVITANDGTASASLKAFSLTVTQTGNGSATLSWLPPTTNTNGTVLTNLAGYQIKYGTNSGALSQTIQVANPGLTTYVISNLSPGTYYFGTLAYTSTGTQSKLSSLVSKTIH
jgi:hypothetical protein